MVILLPEKNKQKLDVSSEGPSSRVDEAILVTSSFCLFFSCSNITTQHSNFLSNTVACRFFLGPIIRDDPLNDVEIYVCLN